MQISLYRRNQGNLSKSDTRSIEFNFRSDERAERRKEVSRHAVSFHFSSLFCNYGLESLIVLYFVMHL